MTTEKKPHPLAHILRAIADGDAVEVAHHRADTWTTWVESTHVNPINCGLGYKWRITPKSITRWMNMYASTNPAEGFLYESRKAADNGAGNRRIACIEITFKEGDGLNTAGDEEA